MNDLDEQHGHGTGDDSVYVVFAATAAELRQTKGQRNALAAFTGDLPIGAMEVTAAPVGCTEPCGAPALYLMTWRQMAALQATLAFWISRQNVAVRDQHEALMREVTARCVDAVRRHE
jgi:hypothetical protein